MAVCNITACPVATSKRIRQKTGKQKKTLTRPAQQVMFWAESSKCNLPLFNRVVGQVKVQAGK